MNRTSRIDFNLFACFLLAGLATLMVQMVQAERSYIDAVAMRSDPMVRMTSAFSAPGREHTAEKLVDAVILIESGGNASAVGLHGERGLMQITSGTWQDVTAGLYGCVIPFEHAFDPDVNRRVGRAYLGYLHEFLLRHRDDWQSDERSLLLACYNAGPARVLHTGFCMDRLPRSTRDYIKRAAALHDNLLAGQENRVRRSGPKSFEIVAMVPSVTGL